MDASQAIYREASRIIAAENRQREDLARASVIADMRIALLDAIQRSAADRGELCEEIAEDIYLVDGGVNLQWLAESAVDVLTKLLTNPPSMVTYPDGTTRVER
jgi:hypothetical protein